MGLQAVAVHYPTGESEEGATALNEKRTPGFGKPMNSRSGAYAGLRTSSSALPSPSEG